MQRWNGWPLERLIYLFLAIALLAVWGQIYLFHGVVSGFEYDAQYAPMWMTPLMVAAALWYAVVRNPAVRMSFLTLFAGGVIVGLFGMYFHGQSINQMSGGWTLQNVALGPPILLPIIYTAVSAFGILVALWPLKLGARRATEPETRRHIPPGMPAAGRR